LDLAGISDNASFPLEYFVSRRYLIRRTHCMTIEARTYFREPVDRAPVSVMMPWEWPDGRDLRCFGVIASRSDRQN
jgi:hypothetical protein